MEENGSACEKYLSHNPELKIIVQRMNSILRRKIRILV